MTTFPLKGLNLSPTDATLLVHGVIKEIFQPGDTRYRGPIIVRSNKTIPPNGQELDSGYRVERDGDEARLVKIGGRKSFKLHPGLILGTAYLAETWPSVNGYVWRFVQGVPSQQQCPAGCTERNGKHRVQNANRKWVICKVCDGEGTCDPIDDGTVIRRAWFQWRPQS